MSGHMMVIAIVVYICIVVKVFQSAFFENILNKNNDKKIKTHRQACRYFVYIKY